MTTSPPALPDHLTHPKYRADIDGLRAVAIPSVVSFHAFPFWVKGGFIGVDVFFRHFTFERQGFGFRNTSEAELEGNIGFDEAVKYNEQYSSFCKSGVDGYVINGNRVGNNVGCQQSKINGKVDIAIMGDSHAGHLFIGLAEELRNVNIVALSLYGINGLPYITNNKFEKVYSYILNSDIETIIISNYWANPSIDLFSGSSEDALLKTVDALIKSGKKVYITDDIPSFTSDPSNCKYQRKFSSNHKCFESASKFYDLAVVMSQK